MTRLPLLLLFSWGLGGAGCGEGSGGGAAPSDGGSDGVSDAGSDGPAPVPLYDFSSAAPWYACPSAEFPDGATVVEAMDQVDHYITFGPGGVDQRDMWADVEFPEGDWAQVGLWFQLECPESGLCDHWDRYGSVQLVLNPGDAQADWEYVELTRHVTPYRIEMCQYIDVTPMADLLAGPQKLHSFIDTWVGPGHANGDGWRVSVKFVFYPGERAQPDQVIPIWGKRHITVGNTDPAANVDSQIDPVTVDIPADATRVEAHMMTTGHGFGFSGNCAEFCEMRQDVIVNGQVHSVNPWRGDCADNPVSPQYGTWQYDRNGWCPGAIAVGDMVDVTESIDVGEGNEIDFDIRTGLGDEYSDTSGAGGDPYEVISLKLYVYR